MNLKLFKQRNFLLLMQGKFVSQLGSVLQTFALSLYVLNTYESATLFASVLVIGTLPRLILSPIAGVFVDWFDRKKIIVLLDIFNGLTVVCIILLYYSTGTLPLWSIYAIVIMLSLINTVFSPAISTVIPTIMDSDELFSANTIDQFVMTIANILAPIIAGILMGFSHIGVIMIINAFSFFISAFTEVFINLPKNNKKPEKINFQAFKIDFIDGLVFFKKQTILFRIMLMALVLNFAFAPIYSVAIPYMLKRVLFISDVHFGLFESVVVGASIIAMFVAGFISKRYTIEKIIRVDFGIQPILVSLIALVSTSTFLSLFVGYTVPFISIILISCIIVIMITIGNIAMNTTLQKLIPKDKLGRAMTVVGTVCGAAMPLGQGLMGIAIDYMPIWSAIMISVLFLVAVAILAALTLKDGMLEAKPPSPHLEPIIE